MDLHILGVDIAKLKFNVCLIREDGRLRHRVFANNPAGFTHLSEWLKKNHVSQVHACLEATGTYSEALAKSPLTPGWCRVKDNRAAVSEGVHVCPRSAMRGCAKHCTFRPSLP